MIKKKTKSNKEQTTSEKVLNKTLKKKEEMLDKYLKNVAKMTKIPDNIQIDKNKNILKIILILENQIAFLKGLNLKRENKKEMTIKEKQYNDYLNIVNNTAIEHEIEKRRIIIKEIKKYLEKEENLQPFSSFYTLTLIITELYTIKCLTKEEYLDIIMYFIKLNIDLGILEQNNRTKFTTIHELDNKMLLYFKGKANPNIVSMLATIINMNNTNFKEIFIEATRNIQEHYIDKKNNYTENDIEIILSALKQLQIFATANDIVRKALSKQMKKQENRKIKIKKKAIEVTETGKITINHFINETEEKEERKPITMTPYFTASLKKNEIDKEQTKKRRTIQEIKKELAEYIDLYNFEIKKQILPKTRSHIIELLIDLEKERKEINTFIICTNLSLTYEIEKGDIKILRQIFAENRRKYYFYYETKGYIQLEKHIKFLEEVFDLLSTERDINIIKQFEYEIKSELLTLENICPATHEYEFRELEKYKQMKKY